MKARADLAPGSKRPQQAMTRASLDQNLRAAHANADSAALIDLYTRAADHADACADQDAACFYLTHAFVFALEAGAQEARALNARLAARGRATLLDWSQDHPAP